MCSHPDTFSVGSSCPDANDLVLGDALSDGSPFLNTDDLGFGGDEEDLDAFDFLFIRGARLLRKRDGKDLNIT